MQRPATDKYASSWPVTGSEILNPSVQGDTICTVVCPAKVIPGGPAGLLFDIGLTDVSVGVTSPAPLVCCAWLASLVCEDCWAKSEADRRAAMPMHITIRSASLARAVIFDPIILRGRDILKNVGRKSHLQRSEVDVAGKNVLGIY